MLPIRLPGQVIAHIEQHQEERLARAFGSHPLNRNHTMKRLLAENLAVLVRTGFSCKRARAGKCSTKIHGFISESLIELTGSRGSVAVTESGGNYTGSCRRLLLLLLGYRGLITTV